MMFLAICNHTDWARESAIGFLDIYSNTDWVRESAIGFLDICNHADYTRKSTMGFLAICMCPVCPMTESLSILCCYRWPGYP